MYEEYTRLPAALISPRLAPANISCGCVKDERAVRTDVEAVGAFNGKCDGRGVCMRGDVEVILEPPSGAVVDQIDSWIDVGKPNLGEVRDLRFPVRSVTEG
jgi:hypothetical protein